MPTILFVPLSEGGHINSCIGIGQALRSSGHKVVFAVREASRDRLLQYGFEVEKVGPPSANKEDDLRLYEENVAPLQKLPPEDKIETFILIANLFFIQNVQDTDDDVKVLISKLQPDVIVLDGYASYPSIESSGIPWVWLHSANPININEHPDLPPPYSGYSVHEKDEEKWRRFRQRIVDHGKKNFRTEFNDWLVARGGTPLKSDIKIINDSHYLNLYMYPQELDYTNIRPLPDKWVAIDNLMRYENKEPFEIPEKLATLPGKLVYVAMGSLACMDIDLINHIIEQTKNMPHRFIISEGPHSGKYELSANQWGKEVLPQIQILPQVDLVITHGGNNTVTETFYFGKPIIAMPVFDDQYDNAQRLEDTGLGIRLHPYEFTADELENAINKLCNDEALLKKLVKISKRIQATDGPKEAALMIEKLIAS